MICRAGSPASPFKAPLTLPLACARADLKHQNQRGTYVDAFWHVVNWSVVAERYDAAMRVAVDHAGRAAEAEAVAFMAREREAALQVDGSGAHGKSASIVCADVQQAVEMEVEAVPSAGSGGEEEL